MALANIAARDKAEKERQAKKRLEVFAAKLGLDANAKNNARGDQYLSEIKFTANILNQFGRHPAQEIYSLLHDHCSVRVFGACVLQDGSVQILKNVKDGLEEFQNLVKPGAPLDVKVPLTNAYGNGKPFMSRLPHSKFSLYSDFYGNYIYGYVGRASGISEQKLLDASHGHFSIGPLRKTFDAGNTDGNDDISIRMGYELEGEVAPGEVTGQDIYSDISANLGALRAKKKIFYTP